MGLRLVAHYYDRMEALIVGAALDAAGVPCFLENYFQNALKPFHEIALGGYRLMVCEEDLPTALAVIDEARRKRSFDGERLVRNYHLAAGLLLTGFLWFLTSPVIPLPLRTHSWRTVDADPPAMPKR